jgi:indolepyruvate ferredoxin oxidoreductase beta subunit
MSQRGGSVNSHVRWGEKVLSPVIGQGEVDVLLALEKLESLRYIKWLRQDGIALLGEFKIPPLTVSSGDDLYPEDNEIKNVLGQVTRNFYFIPTLSLAEQAGNSRAHNVVLLGALSILIEDVSSEIWLDVIDERVPKKAVEINRKAFSLGQALTIAG